MRLYALAARAWGPAVYLGWAVLAGLLVAYLARHGRNLPFQDEWAFAPVLFERPLRWGWAFEQHNEHWFVPGRLLYLAVMTLSGQDFRAGMVVSLILLCAAGLFLLRAARAARGRHVPTDFWFPVLMMSGTHGENLTMAYQLVFTLTSVSGAAALYLIATSPTRPPGRTGLYAAPVLTLIVLGGSPGLSLGLPLAGWVVFVAYRAWAAGDRRRALASLVAPAAALAYSAWVVSYFLRYPTPHAHNPPSVAAGVAFEFLAAGLGMFASDRWPLWGYAVAGMYAAAIPWLGWVALRRRDERPFALGLLAVIAGVFVMAAGVGWIRVTGWYPRYACLSSLGIAAVGLAAARYLPWRLLFVPATLALLLLAVYFLRGNWLAGKQYAFPNAKRADELTKDIARGVPLDVLADRDVLFPCGEYRRTLRELRAGGFRPFVGITDGPPLKAAPVAVPPPGELPQWHPATGAPRPRLEVRLPRPVRVAVVRVHYNCDYGQLWHDLRLGWVADDSPDTPVHSDEVYPWVVPGDSVVAFWIDGPVSRFWLEPKESTQRFPVRGLTLYLPADEPAP